MGAPSTVSEGLLIPFTVGAGEHAKPAPFLTVAPTPHASPFTYPAWDLMTMRPLDPLPYTSVSFGQQINTAGPFAGTLPISDPRVQNLEYLQATRTGRTALFVDYLGVLVWGGIIWTRRYQKTTRQLLIGAQEFGSYFARRLQPADYATTWETGADPMFIVKQILEETLAKGTILGGITLNLEPAGGSGQRVVVTYPGTQLQTVESIITTLSQMGFTYGFDYGFTWRYVEHEGRKQPAVTMSFYYPREGRTADRSGIVVLDRECLDSAYDEDASKQANIISETGSGSGGLLPITAEADNVLAAGYPRLEEAVSHTQVNDESVLGNIALGDLTLRSWPVTTPWVELPVPYPDPTGRLPADRAVTFGDFKLGDDMIYRVDSVSAGENMDPRWPDGMMFEWRIVAWSCTVAEHGLSKLHLDLGLPPVSATNILAPAPPE